MVYTPYQYTNRHLYTAGGWSDGAQQCASCCAVCSGPQKTLAGPVQVDQPDSTQPERQLPDESSSSTVQAEEAPVSGPVMQCSVAGMQQQGHEFLHC